MCVRWGRRKKWRDPDINFQKAIFRNVNMYILGCNGKLRFHSDLCGSSGSLYGGGMLSGKGVGGCCVQVFAVFRQLSWRVCLLLL